MDFPAIFAQTFAQALYGIQTSIGMLSTYKTLYDRLFGGLAGITTAQMITKFGTDAGQYFKLVSDLKNFLDARAITVPNGYQTIPAYTIHQDGTVTMN